MQKSLKDMLAKIFADKARHKKAVAVVSMLSVLVVTGVFWQLMQPVITKTAAPVCGIEEHTHGSGCHSRQLACGQDEGEEHTHADGCYQQVLVCGSKEHKHNDGCYPEAIPEPTLQPVAAVSAVSETEEETSAAEQVEAPAATEASVETVSENTENIETTEAPAGTEAPVDVVMPENTAEATAAPEVTADPEATVAPEATAEVTAEPTAEVSAEPTVEVTVEPSVEPTAEPTAEPLTLGGLSASAGSVRVGESVSWSYAAAGATQVTYALTDENGAQVAGGEASGSISWLADRAGSFTMTVTATNGVDTRSVSSTITVEGVEELTLSVACEAASAFAGDSVRFSLVCAGGAEPKTCVIEVRQNGALLAPYTEFHNSVTVQTNAASSVTSLTLEAMVRDAMGTVVTASREIPLAVHDKESAADWARSAYVELTGNWVEDLIAVAKTQLGYHESDIDFVLNSEGKRQGYTRYGDWYGMNYEEWCAMFASFCLKYADIPSSYVPHQAGCQKWIGELNYLGLFEYASGDYEPQAGDLIFFDWNNSGDSDHVGIVVSADENEIHTIEGNSGAAVREKTYAANDETIMGYASVARAYEKYLADEAQDEVIEAMLPEDLTGQTAQVSVESANLRAAAPDGEVLAVLNSGDQVTILAVEGDWYQVSAAERTGWVRGDLVEIVMETEPETEDGPAVLEENLVPDTVYGELKTHIEVAYAANDAAALADLEAQTEQAYANAEITEEEYNELIALIYGEVKGEAEIELMNGAEAMAAEPRSIRFLCCETCAADIANALAKVDVVYPEAAIAAGETVSNEYIPSAADVNAYFACADCGVGKEYSKVLDGWYILDETGAPVPFVSGMEIPENILNDGEDAISVYASWKDAPQAISVVFNNADGSELAVINDAACYTAFGAIKPEALAIEGCTFVGWSADGGETFAEDGDILSADAVYTAVYEAAITVVKGETASAYTVRVGQSLADAVDAEGNGISAAILADGRIFTGWLAEGETAPITDLSACIPAGAMTITAQYEAARTISFMEKDFMDADADGDVSELTAAYTFYAVDGSAMSTAIDAEGTVIAALPEGMSSEPFEFLGWQTVAEDGTAAEFTLDTVITADVAVQANYREMKTVSVTFTYDGESYVYDLPDNTYTFGDALSMTMVAPLSDTVSVLPINEIMEDRVIAGPSGKPMIHSFSGWAYNEDLDGDLDARDVVQAKEEMVISTDMTFFPTYVSGYSITLHDIAPDGTEVVREDASMDLMMRYDEGAKAYFDEMPVDEDTLAADCIWYTVDADGNREKLDAAVLDAPLASGEELHVYTYSYQIVLTLEEETTEEGQNLLDLLIPAANAEVKWENNQLIIIVRENETLSYGDFVIEGVDYSLYTWTFKDANGNTISDITSIADLIDAFNNKTWNVGTQITATGTPLYSRSITRSITFYAHVNDNWTVIDTRTMTLYYVDSYYCLSAAQLESVYDGLGFEMSALQFSGGDYTVFPYQTSGGSTSQAVRARYVTTGNGFSRVTSSNSTSSTSSSLASRVYYMPGTSITSSNAQNLSSYDDSGDNNSFYTITVEDNGTVYTAEDAAKYDQYVLRGEDSQAITLSNVPASGNTDLSVVWKVYDSDGTDVTSSYATSNSATKTTTISKITGVTEQYTIEPVLTLPPGMYSIVYDVNIIGTPTDHTPTVNNAAVYTDIVNTNAVGFTEYLVLSPNYTTYSARSSIVVEAPNRANYKFAGWTVEGKAIEAGEPLKAEDLAELAPEGTVTLTANWVETDETLTANFYVHLVCESVDQNDPDVGLASNYTTTITSSVLTIKDPDGEAIATQTLNSNRAAYGFNTSGSEMKVITEDNYDDPLGSDRDIRSLYSANGYLLDNEGDSHDVIFKLDGFPSDAQVLEEVQRKVREEGINIYLTEEDFKNGTNPVPVTQITPENFAVRWYVFKYYGGSSGDNIWHIDGNLVIKRAQFAINKTFYGYSDAISEVKENFAVTYKPENGTATTLTLDDAELVNGVYTWHIDDANRGVKYIVNETNYKAPDQVNGIDIATLPEYMVSTNGRWQTYTDNSVVEITPKTYAVDVAVSEIDSVSFLNSYLPKNTVVLRKVDSTTGASLSGVSFKLTEADGTIPKLYWVEASSKYYMYPPTEEADGKDAKEITDGIITVGSDGSLMIVGLQEEDYVGQYKLTEIETRTGYSLLEKPVVFTTYDNKDGMTLDDNSDGHASVDVSGIILRITNDPHTPKLYVEKEWRNTTNKLPVQLELSRNGTPIKTFTLDGTLDTGTTAIETRAWRGEFDMPLYVDGELAEYTLRETVIGTPGQPGGELNSPTEDDGFLDYEVYYYAMQYRFASDSTPSTNPIRVDANGETEYADIYLTVANEPYTGAPTVLKINENNQPLDGATFTVYRTYDPETGTLSDRVTSGTSGEGDNGAGVVKLNLAAGEYYMVETGAPAGYTPDATIYKIVVSGRGNTITKLSDTSANPVKVTEIQNLPSTASIKVVKLDGQGKALNGAEFQITKDGNSYMVNGGTSSKFEPNNEFTLNDLPVGKYSIVESKAPAGYYAMTGSIDFEIAAGAVAPEEELPEGVSYDKTTNTFTIRNHAGVELPHTGGDGTTPYTICGLLLMLSALLYGCGQRRKRERRVEG